MFRIFLSLFICHKLKKNNIVNNLCLDDYIPDNINKTINKNLNNNWLNIIALNTNKTIVSSNSRGYDQRFNNTESNRDLEKIINNLNKHNLLKILEDSNINIEDKLNIIKKDETYSSIKIENGGLFDDWNFDFDNHKFKFDLLF